MIHIKKYHLLLLFTLICIGMLFSILLFNKFRQLERKEFQEDFKHKAQHRINILQKEIDDKVDIMKSIKAIFDIYGLSDRVKFQSYTKFLLDHEKHKHPNHRTGIQVLSWAPRVFDAERMAYEQLVRRSGYPDFQITERKEQGVMVRAKKRDEYFPVYYLEPFEGNELALGFDLASNPSRLKAIITARDTGEITASEKIILVQETENQSAFILFEPIYYKEMQTDSVQVRQNELSGFITGVFRIGDLVEDSLSVVNPGDVSIYIYDADQQNPNKRFLYSYPSQKRIKGSVSTANEAAISQDYHYRQPLKVANRTWQVYAIPTQDLYDKHSHLYKWAFSIGMLIFTILLAGYLYSIFNQGEQKNLYLSEILEQKELLSKALAEVKTLQGLIPICSYCKKTRDDKGYWQQIESYIASQTEARFTHGICPECYKEQVEKLDDPDRI